MSEYLPVLVTLGGAVLVLVAALYVMAAVTATARSALDVVPFAGGCRRPSTPSPGSTCAGTGDHGVPGLRHGDDLHVPWTLVVSRVGPAAVIEMFVFLGILVAAVVYAWREGALRWT